ncbi:MAG TPA: ATP-binding protein [Ignavibacteriaceae bacterium]|nr:ATP-binding protein [Ignavibacteriaceae bacterium]
MKTKNNIEKELKVKSRTENLSVIREFIQSAAVQVGMNPGITEDVMLAVDEACTNIIKHAYKSVPDGEIFLKLKYSDHKFTIKIIDYGNSFHPENVPDPDLQKYYNQHRVGGLGMYLMKTLMDEVKYSSVPGKYNQVYLTKYLNNSN